MALLTAEKYAVLDIDCPSELIRGVVIYSSFATARHGQICSSIVKLVCNHSHQHSLGHVLCNNSGTITQRDPDTVRGPDVAFYDYQRVPRGKLPDGYLPVSPDLVFEVLSPDDRWSNVLRKVTEYLLAGVQAVCVLDPEDESLRVYRDDKPEAKLAAEDEFTIPEILSGFACRVGKFFE